jgi:hypothetical protein
MDPNVPQETRSVSELIRELRDETTHLFKQEIHLAKTEVSEKLSLAGRSAAYLAAGGAVAYAGLIVLLIGLGALAAVGLDRAGLQTAVAAALGPILVGVIVALIGFLLLMKAKKNLSKEPLKPERTINSIKENKEWTQQKLQHQ